MTGLQHVPPTSRRVNQLQRECRRGCPAAVSESRKAMHDSDEDFTQLDDPAFLAERTRVRETIEALTERYKALTAEFDRRAAAKWTEEAQ
jgi:hypothetical protein